MNDQVDPSHIMQTATAFWASKTLLAAVELDLFSVLGKEPMTARQLGDALELHPRGTFDFFDALVALGFLHRDGNGSDARYRNTAETDAFLNKASERYIGGIPRMLNSRLYRFWGDLEEALRTGAPQSETKHSGRSIFENLYGDEETLNDFLEAMSGLQAPNFEVLAEKFDFSRYKTVCDAGGALALLSLIVGRRHPHLSFTTFDLPPVAPLAQKRIEAADMADRIKVASGDFFQDDLPKADVITMGNVLHDWNLEKKMVLIRKAYDALPDGGAFIVIENIIDDERRRNVPGLLMSLNMLIELGDAFDFSGADFRSWCNEIGFSRYEQLPLLGAASAAIAYK